MAELVVQAAIGALVSTGVGLAARALAPKPKKTRSSVNGPTAKESPLAQSSEPGGPQIGIFGRRRVGGRVILSAKADGKTYIVMVLAGAPATVNAVYLNNSVVAISSEEIVSAPWFAGGEASIQIKIYDGTQTAADAELMAAFDGWTSEFIGERQTYARIIIDPSLDPSFEDLYKSGIPDFTFDVSGFPCYDPRNLDHDIDDPDTWTFSENASIIEANYAVHELGRALPKDRIDWDSVAAAADYDDEAVTTLSGLSEPRYSASLVWTTDERHEDVHERIGRAHGMDAGGLFLNGLKYQMGTGVYLEPTAEVTPEDYEGDGLSVSDSPPLDTIANGVRGKFASPINNYEMRDYPAFQDADALAEDGGQAYWLELDFECVTRVGQAQRLARIAYHKARYGFPASLGTQFKHFDTIRNDVIQINDSLMGLVEQTFRVESDRVSADYALRFELVHEREDFYDWNAATDEKPMPLPVNLSGGAGTDPDVNGALMPPGIVCYDTQGNPSDFFYRATVDIAETPSDRATHYDWEVFENGVSVQTVSVAVGTATSTVVGPRASLPTKTLEIRIRSRVSSTGEVSAWAYGVAGVHNTVTFENVTTGASTAFVLPPPRAPQLASSSTGTADLDLIAAPGARSTNIQLFESTNPNPNTATKIYDAANGNTTRTVTGTPGTFKFYWTRVQHSGGKAGPFSNTLIVAF